MTNAGAAEEHLDIGDLGLALLGFASGSMDALALLNLRQVFPSAMTGNTALLGVALGQQQWIAASRPFIASAGFLAGACAASAGVDLWFGGSSAPYAVRWLLAVEACLLAVFAAISQLADRPIAGVWPYSLILLASSAMGIQSLAARVVDRPAITTVVFTSTLTAIAIAASAALLRRPHRLPFVTKRQLGMFLILRRRRCRRWPARRGLDVDRVLAVLGRGRGGRMPLARAGTGRHHDLKRGIIGVAPVAAG